MKAKGNDQHEFFDHAGFLDRLAGLAVKCQESASNGPNDI
jgi:hypothetical protein